MKKDLRNKAIKIRGKDYVLVSDRILFFNEQYPNGSIETEIVSMENNLFVVRAIVRPDIKNPNRIFVGHSQAKLGGDGVNKNSALENAETSAVGRALAMMGIGVIDSVASADEMVKAGAIAGSKEEPASERQINWLAKKTGKTIEEIRKMGLTKKGASNLINKLLTK